MLELFRDLLNTEGDTLLLLRIDDEPGDDAFVCRRWGEGVDCLAGEELVEDFSLEERRLTGERPLLKYDAMCTFLNNNVIPLSCVQWEEGRW